MTAVTHEASSNAPPPDEYLTRQEAALEARVTERTIYNWIRAGQLNADRTPAGHYRIRRSWLAAAMHALEP